MDLTIFFNIILTDLSKLSLSFKTKHTCEGKNIVTVFTLLWAQATINKILS